MNSQQRKIIRDHAKRAGHLVDLWDADDLRWYAKHKFCKEKKAVSKKTPYSDEQRVDMGAASLQTLEHRLYAVELRREYHLRRLYRDRAPQFDRHRTHAVERNAISGEDAFMVTVVLTLLTVAFVLLFGA